MRVHESKTVHIAEAFKALSDPTRVRIVNLLLVRGELCVCDVETILDISQSSASRHLNHLKAAGIASDRRDRTWVYYRIHRPASPLWRDALRELRRDLEDDPTATRDLEAASRLARDGSCAPITDASRASAGKR